MGCPDAAVGEKRVYKRFFPKDETSVVIQGDRTIAGVVSDLSFMGMRIEYPWDASDHQPVETGSPVSCSFDGFGAALRAVPATVMYDLAASDTEPSTHRVCALRFQELSFTQALALNRLFS